MTVTKLPWLLIFICILHSGIGASDTNSQQTTTCKEEDWTDYFDGDDPTGRGDFETLDILNKKYPEEICSNPIAAEGRVKGDTNDNSLSSQNVVVSKIGLVCKNINQYCRDYEVRFCCPKIPECVNGEWTSFLDSDDPTGRCDCELMPRLRLKYGDKICEKPTAIDARRVADQKHWHYTDFVSAIDINLERGFRCDNTLDKRCDDFEIRLCCPKVIKQQCGPNDWTAWLNCDTPSGLGDIETIDAINERYPESISCATPAAIEIRTADDGVLYNPQISAWNMRASPTYGFSCYNEPHMQCRDFTVRFCCPKNNVVPECTNGKWTDYFDSDDPTGQGDFETISSLKKTFPDQFCTNPIAIDARLVGTDIHHPVDGRIAHLSIEDGFSCKTSDNNAQCGDYEVRFCCPPPSEKCIDGRWTDFFNVDSPNEGGDFEDLSTHYNMFPDKLCPNPTAIDVRTSAGTSYSVRNQNVLISLKKGFRCYNNQPPGQDCCDYKVRYCCPEKAECEDKCSRLNGKWTEFFDIDDPSSSTDGCDCELLSSIRAIDSSVCQFPVAIDARLLNNANYTTAHQIVDLSLSEGFSCRNSQQQPPATCQDYKVRFCCTKEEEEEMVTVADVIVVEEDEEMVEV